MTYDKLTWVFSFTTVNRLNRSHWTKLPMPSEVIARVHEMAG